MAIELGPKSPSIDVHGGDDGGDDEDHQHGTRSWHATRL